jgi:uncharacterized protein YkwD
MTVSPVRLTYRVFVLAAALVICIAPCNRTHAQQLKEFDADYLEAPRGGPDLERAETEILGLTNELREKQGRPKLTRNKKLARAAAYFAAYMGRTDKYGHEADGNAPDERITAFEYDYCIEAENIAYQTKSDRFSTADLAQKFFEIWRDSPGHRENMLDADLKEVGIAIGYSPASNRYYAVQNFGRPTSAAIYFAVVNRTEEALKYTVRTSGVRDNGEREPIELPPQSKMVHRRCRTSTIDWGWTKNDDRVPVADKRDFIVVKSGSEFRVSQQQPNARTK